MSVAFEYPVDLTEPAELAITPGQNSPTVTRLRAVVPYVEDTFVAARPYRRGLASITHLRSLDTRSVTPPVRLTRRGAVVLGAVVAVLGGALITTAWLSAPPSASSPQTAPIASTVVVRTGDSLWSVAERVAPNTDPRAEVATLQRINRLSDSTLLPGQLLRIR